MSLHINEKLRQCQHRHTQPYLIYSTPQQRRSSQLTTGWTLMINRTMHFCFVHILFCFLHGNDQMFGISSDQCLLRSSVALSLGYTVIPANWTKTFHMRVSSAQAMHTLLNMIMLLSAQKTVAGLTDRVKPGWALKTYLSDAQGKNLAAKYNNFTVFYIPNQKQYRMTKNVMLSLKTGLKMVRVSHCEVMEGGSFEAEWSDTIWYEWIWPIT